MDEIAVPNPIWTWSDTGLLTDVWTLIDACPIFDRGDFYLSALEAHEYNGGLWAFPTNIGFEYVGINARLPQSFIERFKSYSVISMSELMAVYSDLMESYESEFGHLSFSSGAGTGRALDTVVRSMASFIDFENRVSYLDSEQFTEFLQLTAQSYTSLELHWRADWGTTLAYPHFIREMPYEFVFSVYDHQLSPGKVFLSLNEPYFIHHMPITGECGRLRASHRYHSSNWWTWSFPAAGNGELAWEFTRHLIYAMVNPTPYAQQYPTVTMPFDSIWGRGSVSTPILRSLTERQIYQGINRAIDFDDMRRRADSRWGNSFAEYVYTAEGRALGVQNTLARLEIYNEMPIIMQPFFPAGLRDGITDILDRLLRRLITAEAAAQQMHNRVSLWLIE